MQSGAPDPFGREYFATTYGGGRGSYQARTTPIKWRSMCRFIDQNVPDFRDALDVGCAEGSFLAHAVKRFPRARWSGTDVSEYATEIARRAVPCADIRRCEATSLDFADASFDCVTAFDVLEHLPDLDRAVSDLARVLRPGGSLIVTVPVYDGPVGWIVRALDRDPTHVHKLARQEWLRGPLSTRFELNGWQGAWRYFAGIYWHYRATLGRSAAPAIVMAWKLRG